MQFINNTIICALNDLLNNNISVETATSYIGRSIGCIATKCKSIWSLNKLFYLDFFLHFVIFTVFKKSSLSTYIKYNDLRYKYNNYSLTKYLFMFIFQN